LGVWTIFFEGLCWGCCWCVVVSAWVFIMGFFWLSCSVNLRLFCWFLLVFVRFCNLVYLV